MEYTAYIGLGSNLPSFAGGPAETIEAAMRDLEKLGAVSARSSLYRTAPVGFREQPEFINAAARLSMLRIVRSIVARSVGSLTSGRFARTL